VEFLPDDGHAVPIQSGETMSTRLASNEGWRWRRSRAIEHLPSPAEQFDVHPKSDHNMEKHSSRDPKNPLIHDIIAFDEDLET
jgi:hypothetical protein